MSNVALTSGNIPQLPAELLNAFSGMADTIFSNVGGSAMRFIKVRKTDFFLDDGGDGVAVPFNSLFCVLLGAAPFNHAVWYKEKYVPGQSKNDEPDLIWLMKQDGVYPDALPQAARQKVMNNGRMMWDFSIKRRTVWAVVKTDPQNGFTIDVDKPYCFDIPSSSLYSKSNPNQNEYSWSGIANLCRSYSGNGMIVVPSMFLTQIVPDVNGTNGTVKFRPAMSQDGKLQFLNNEMIMMVYNATQSQDVKDLCNVREKLTYDGATSQVQPQVQTQAPVQFATAPQAPAAPQQAPAPQPAPKPVQPVAQPAPQPAPQPQQPAQPAPNKAAVDDTMDLLNKAQALLNNNQQPQAQPQQQSAVADNVAALLANFGK